MSVPVDHLSMGEQKFLLQRARQALEQAVIGQGEAIQDLTQIPENLRKKGATFVTLTKFGELRGCIGTLEAYQPLVEDVREHAVAAGLKDFRFPPVTEDELSDIKIEISRLTAPQPVLYDFPLDLPKKLRPGVDGVIIRDGRKRATFLPQVWAKLPDPQDFLDHLCLKMGISSDLWRRRIFDVMVYQVEEFYE